MLRDHPGALLALVLSLALAVLAGCLSRTESVLHPGAKVTRSGLAAEVVQQQSEFDGRAAKIRAEVDAYKADLSAAQERDSIASAELDRQDSFKITAVNLLGTVATLGADKVDPTGTTSGLVKTAIATLFVGSFCDSLKKGQQLKKLRTAPTDPPALPPTIDTPATVEIPTAPTLSASPPLPAVLKAA